MIREFVRGNLVYRCVDVIIGFTLILGRPKTEQHLFIYPVDAELHSLWFHHIDLESFPEADRRAIKDNGFRPKHVFFYDSSKSYSEPT